MLRAIDIASWQEGIRPSQVDCDIVIVKATGGTTYSNPFFREWADEALASGKLLGIYHFANDVKWGSAHDEARHFLEAVAPYKGRFVPILDWEADAVDNGQGWAVEWMAEVARETGATPMFYGYASNVNSSDYSELAGYPLWMASYLNRYQGSGWTDPVNTWGTGDWDSMAMYQYTSTGRVDGYGGDLDLSVFYGGKEDWERLQGGTMGTAQGLIDVAYSYLGTTEDDPRFRELIDYYNEHTDGYDMQYWDEWCACFVSVCSLKSGNAGATGTSVNCASFRNIWAEKGILRGRWETPAPGWLIDYDWQQDGIPDHIGIVVDCDGETIHVIEGNTDGEMCAEHWIPVGSYSISCFGAPDYEGDAPKQVPGDPVNDAGLHYRAHVQTAGWLPSVRDGQTAGTTGYAKRLEAFKVTPPEGWTLYASVHVQGEGWKTYHGIEKGESSGEGSSENDPIIGTTGEAKRIECIIIGVEKRPEGDKRKLYFQVHQQSVGWKAWTPEGYASGTDGMALRLEAVRMKIE